MSGAGFSRWFSRWPVAGFLAGRSLVFSLAGRWFSRWPVAGFLAGRSLVFFKWVTNTRQAISKFGKAEDTRYQEVSKSIHTILPPPPKESILRPTR